MKRTRKLADKIFISFNGINYSIYRKEDNGDVAEQVFLTVEDIDYVNDFVFFCEKQSLDKNE